MSSEKLSENEVVKIFSNILDLPNKTDGTLHIYPAEKGKATKPDGYYYFEGITFILDAKAQGKAFTGQLEDYMRAEKNDNYIGFKYNKDTFLCYVKGKLVEEEIEIKNKEYYRERYFPNKISNESIVEKSAKKLANLFRVSNMDMKLTQNPLKLF